MPRSRRHRGDWSFGRTVLLLALTLPFLYPFAFLVSLAVKPIAEFNDDPVDLPQHPTLDNLTDAWSEAGLGQAMLNSALAVCLGVVITVLVSTAAAYWFVRHTSRAARVLRYALIGTISLPAPIFIIPLFVMLSEHGATDNLFVLALVYAAWNGSFGLYLVYTYFRSLPRDTFEAAQVDGASGLQVFARIYLPLSRPAVATLAALAFIASWSDLLISVVLVQDAERRLLTPATALLNDRYNADTPKVAAGVLIAILPMLLVFLLGQRWIVRGMTAGVNR
jgi:ABC-type glycerol-3-phosphate transport system permease component